MRLSYASLCLVLASFLAVSVGCTRGDTAPGEPAKQVALDENKEAEKDFGEGKEARAWIASADHLFFKVSKEPVTKLAESLYAAGAPEVRIALITEDEVTKKSIGGGLVAKLPTEATARAKVFDAVNKQRVEMDDEPDKDTGQQYVEFVLD